MLWMDSEVQMMSLRIPLPPPSLNSLHSPTGSLQVAERWPVVAPDLYCPDCFKARENSSLALKFHPSPREDSDWSSPEPITGDYSDWPPLLSWTSPIETALILAEMGRDDSPKTKIEEHKPLMYLRPELQLELNVLWRPASEKEKELGKSMSFKSVEGRAPVGYTKSNVLLSAPH